MHPNAEFSDQPLALGGFPRKRGVFMLNMEYIEYPEGFFPARSQDDSRLQINY